MQSPLKFKWHFPTETNKQTKNNPSIHVSTKDSR